MFISFKKPFFKASRNVPVKISSDLKHLSLLHCFHVIIGITQNQLSACLKDFLQEHKAYLTSFRDSSNCPLGKKKVYGFCCMNSSIPLFLLYLYRNEFKTVKNIFLSIFFTFYFFVSCTLVFSTMLSILKKKILLT